MNTNTASIAVLRIVIASSITLLISYSSCAAVRRDSIFLINPTTPSYLIVLRISSRTRLFSLSVAARAMLSVRSLHCCSVREQQHRSPLRIFAGAGVCGRVRRMKHPIGEGCFVGSLVSVCSHLTRPCERTSAPASKRRLT